MLLTEPSNGELLIKIKYTSICTSDLHTHSGRRMSPTPCVLGHEIIGEIIKMGRDVGADHNGNILTEGDVITWCVYAYDHSSEMALKGIPQKSVGLYKYGHHTFTPNDGLNGGLATHCMLKKGTAVFKFSNEINAKTAAPINCTHATIAGALRLAGDIAQKNILIAGAGMLGLSACAMANDVGAENVYAIDVNKDRLAYSKKFGATKTFEGDLSVEEINAELSIHEKIDIVLDTTGIPAVMEKGLKLLNIGGTAIWVGAVFNQPDTQINAEMIVRNLLTIKGLHNYTPADLASAIRFIEANHKKYPFEELVGAEFPLEELEQAFETAANGKYYRVGIRQ
ncbi:zinc-binding dehydrogenase [Niabella ginsengisoli]|uniref:alcohol dehydrogenase n=1 Tax=Niabella ginsengisoli TaxID=522298 RepID=A0ABS9SIJ3_9BACT|nr:zinc-binding dehydrogenase [Niabella ginsengisoli]MCH5598188.1 zinc-binding dehydrogenase [Niabella ginsengisoli]